MLFKKKAVVKNIPNSYDTELTRLKHLFTDAYLGLESATRDVIIKKGASELYPNGTNKDKATTALKESRLSLIFKLEEYDKVREQYNTYLNKNRDFLNTTKDYFVSKKSSHQIIEDTYKNFYR